MKKYISLALIFSQLAFAQAGVCGTTTTAATSTAEATLLTRMITIGGEKLSHDQWQQEVTSAFNEYQATSQPEGRDERLQQAFVTLGIYTPAQAEVMMTQAHAAQVRLTGTVATTQTQANQALETEFGTLLRAMPQGAQYSSCMERAGLLERVGIGAFLVGVIGIFAQGNSVPADNWASITALSGFGLAVVGCAVAYSCD